ncbi:MAG: hypothetical protein JWQ36_268, partial [Enterovirga sp.]|nr:hypothetical protein [Enterovirga sp.]
MTQSGRAERVICFAHAAYRLAEAYAARPGERVLVARNPD